MKKIVTNKERDVWTYVEMWHTSGWLLKKGQEDPQGCNHQFRASLVFTAFTLEAYLNHIGAKLFKCWNDLERLGPKEKLNIIVERIGIEPDRSRRPWQVIKDLFEFRNDIAHGKSIRLKTTESIPLDKHKNEITFIQTKWEKYCNQNNAKRALEDVEKIIHSIHDAANIQDEMFPFSFGIQSWTSFIKSEKNPK